MYTVTATLVGVAPVMFNAMTPRERAALDGEGGKRKFTKAERIAEASQRVHRSEAGDIIVPAWNLKRMLLDGCQKAGLKEGRSSLVGYLMAEVFFDDASFGTDEPDYIDERVGRVPPRTGAMAVLRRPAFRAGWRLPIAFRVFEDRRSAEDLAEALHTAGLKSGIGAWRPDFGRFLVEDLARD